MPVPGSAAVLVTWLNPRDLPAGATRLLDRDESSRLVARAGPREFHRRAAAAVLLRCAVAFFEGRRLHEVTVRRRCPHCSGEHGPPEVPGSQTRVSVSHAGDRVAVAVSAGGAVGIDVEYPKARPLSLALLRRALGEAEREYLLGLPESRRRREFLRAWTAKEAILKATGEGLRGGPSRLVVDLLSTPLRLHSWAGSTECAQTVRLVELDPGGDHVGTLAMINSDTHPVVYREGRTLVERVAA